MQTNLRRFPSPHFPIEYSSHQRHWRMFMKCCNDLFWRFCHLLKNGAVVKCTRQSIAISVIILFHLRQWVRASSFMRFLDFTQRRTTDFRTPLDEWSARCRDLYLTTHTILKTDKHPCSRLDWNPRSQQASGHRSLCLRSRDHWNLNLR
jgi:hypothetical protein